MQSINEKWNIFFSPAILLISAISWAANEPIAEISGSVIHSELQEPIPFASIVVKDLEGNLVSGNSIWGKQYRKMAIGH